MSLANGSFETAGTAAGEAASWAGTTSNALREFADYNLNPVAQAGQDLPRDTFEEGWEDDKPPNLGVAPTVDQFYILVFGAADVEVAEYDPVGEAQQGEDFESDWLVQFPAIKDPDGNLPQTQGIIVPGLQLAAYSQLTPTAQTTLQVPPTVVLTDSPSLVQEVLIDVNGVLVDRSVATTNFGQLSDFEAFESGWGAILIVFDQTQFEFAQWNAFPNEAAVEAFDFGWNNNLVPDVLGADDLGVAIQFTGYKKRNGNPFPPITPGFIENNSFEDFEAIAIPFFVQFGDAGDIVLFPIPGELLVPLGGKVQFKVFPDDLGGEVLGSLPSVITEGLDYYVSAPTAGSSFKISANPLGAPTVLFTAPDLGEGPMAVMRSTDDSWQRIAVTIVP